MREFTEKPAGSQRSKRSLFGLHLNSFVSTVLDLGYSRSSVRGKVFVLGKFERWLKRRRLKITDIHEGIIEEFLYLRRRKGRLAKGDPRALHQFLDHLREKGIVPHAEPTIDTSSMGKLQVEYADYLTNQRGLSPKTISNFWRITQDFLRDCFGDGPIRFQALTTEDISRFLLRRFGASTPEATKQAAAALRSFFRFLFQKGEVARDLAAAVPTVPSWRLVGLPKYLSPAEVQTLLDACNGGTPLGRRDRAVILLLARLGLRACEVTRLELDDIDWRGGELTIRGKGGFHDRLPLPPDTGEALASYLRQDRPACPTRRVFVRAKAPNRGFSHSAAISAIVRRALFRARLHPHSKGAQLLRHSLATEMVRSGATMAEIGEVLRHRAANTTEIYAKVDAEGLRALARPWPVKGVDDEGGGR